MSAPNKPDVMSKPRPSIFRDALQVSPERIARMSEEELDRLMLQLLRAQAYRCGSPVNEICVNTEGKAKDDGCDGWSATPTTTDPWLGSANTCWQFKAGSAGEPARLAGEVVKPIPSETLVSGDRFVVVASGSTNPCCLRILGRVSERSVDFRRLVEVPGASGSVAGISHCPA
jgi:hypothetical protein